MLTVEKGDVIKFQYNNDNTGKTLTRLVKVENVDKNHIAGKDLSVNGYRNFKRNNIDGLTRVARKHDDILPLYSDLFDSITGTTGEQVAQATARLYSHLYSDVRYVKDLDVLVLTPNDNIAVKFDTGVSGKRRSVTLISKGHTVSLGVENNVLSKVFVDDKEVGTDVDALIGALEVLADE